MAGVKEVLGLSPIALGTMRFVEKGLSEQGVLNLIEVAFNKGITTHHSSFEYESYNLYTNALAKFGFRNQVQHIVKLSSPHFEEDAFSAITLEERIDRELKRLNINCIDVLQWLVRSKPINDKARLSILATQKDEIGGCLSKLKSKGKIKRVFAFPYSIPFAEEVVKISEIDGIISYLNMEEQDYKKFADSFPFIAIRPFFGGKLIQETDKKKLIRTCLNYVQSHHHVISIIIGVNDLAHLDGLCKK